jgi:hypothetical protein
MIKRASSEPYGNEGSETKRPALGLDEPQPVRTLRSQRFGQWVRAVERIKQGDLIDLRVTLKRISPENGG